jgi:DNA mismatch endonuclease, patch repair protein
MRAIRRTDTKPEVALRRALHRQGYRFRKDYRLDLAEGKRVRPDIAFTARRVAVFVDGCFWHACPEHGSKPANNTWYWEPKLRRNVERDRVADAALSAAGWDVVRVWEHEPLDAAVMAVLAALTRSGWPRSGPERDAPADAGDPAGSGRGEMAGAGGQGRGEMAGAGSQGRGEMAGAGSQGPGETAEAGSQGPGETAEAGGRLVEEHRAG